MTGWRAFVNDANKTTVGAFNASIPDLSAVPGVPAPCPRLALASPDEALHGREIARRIGLPAGTVTRELAKLVANTRFPVFTERAMRALERTLAAFEENGARHAPRTVKPTRPSDGRGP